MLGMKFAEPCSFCKTDCNERIRGVKTSREGPATVGASQFCHAAMTSTRSQGVGNVFLAAVAATQSRCTGLRIHPARRQGFLKRLPTLFADARTCHVQCFERPQLRQVRYRLIVNAVG